MPFIAYLLDYFDVYTFSDKSVRLSLLADSVSALATLLLILLEPELIIFGSDQLTIAIAGMGMAPGSLLITEVAERLLPIPMVKKETGS